MFTKNTNLWFLIERTTSLIIAAIALVITSCSGGGTIGTGIKDSLGEGGVYHPQNSDTSYITIQGRLRDQAGQALKGISVHATTENSGEVSVLTDEKGEFSFDLLLLPEEKIHFDFYQDKTHKKFTLSTLKPQTDTVILSFQFAKGSSVKLVKFKEQNSSESEE